MTSILFVLNGHQPRVAVPSLSCEIQFSCPSSRQRPEQGWGDPAEIRRRPYRFVPNTAPSPVQSVCTRLASGALESFVNAIVDTAKLFCTPLALSVSVAAAAATVGVWVLCLYAFGVECVRGTQTDLSYSGHGLCLYAFGVECVRGPVNYSWVVSCGDGIVVHTTVFPGALSVLAGAREPVFTLIRIAAHLRGHRLVR